MKVKLLEWNVKLYYAGLGNPFLPGCSMNETPTYQLFAIYYTYTACDDMSVSAPISCLA